MSAIGNFRFHNVGQGLFYSGFIRTGQRQIFSFVYDCGSNSDRAFLEQEIDKFKRLLPSCKKDKSRKYLNLLVISHLHDDHVNGLEYLLENTDVDTVVMPYDERLKTIAGIDSTYNRSFLQYLYEDPVAWLYSRGARRIFLMSIEETGENNEDIERIITLENSPEDNGTPEKVRGRLRLNYSKRWEFIFDNLKLKRAKIDEYVNALIEFMTTKSVSDIQIMQSQTLLFEFARHIKQRVPYFADGKTLNRTSSVLVHRPFKVDKIIYSCIHFPQFCSSDINTVLTGDMICLKNDITLKALQKAENRSIILQYPHHGAKCLVNLDLIKQINADINIIPCGITNTYGHPASEVLKGLLRYFIVNEYTPFDYMITA